MAAAGILLNKKLAGANSLTAAAGQVVPRYLRVSAASRHGPTVFAETHRPPPPQHSQR